MAKWQDGGDEEANKQEPINKNELRSKEEIGLQTRIDKVKLDVDLLKVKKHKKAEDHTGDAGGQAAGEATIDLRQVSSLSLKEKIVLLAGNNIFANVAAAAKAGELSSGEMPALVLDKTLAPTDRRSVHFNKVEVEVPDFDRIYKTGISYREFEASLQRQTVTKAELGVGIPGLFSGNVSYSDAAAMSTFESKITIYFQASQILPKAKFAFSGITLSPEFVRGITAACNARTSEERIDGLLKHLMVHGHFVPTSIISGGRLTLDTSTELNDQSEFHSAKRQLKAAAKAKFDGAGALVEDSEAEGGGGMLDAEESSKRVILQNKELRLEGQGGDPSLANSQASDFGLAWMPSVGPYYNWKRIGFNDTVLVPTINLLPDPLPEDCMRILREYFIEQLDWRRTHVVGAANGEEFGHDMPERRRHKSLAAISEVKRLTEIVVNHGNNVDGLEWSYELHGADGKKLETGDWIGAHRGESYDPRIALKPDEEIIAVEVGIGEPWYQDSALTRFSKPRPEDRIVRQIRIRTNRGWYPSVGYYGRAHVDEYKMIEAPRVRGLFGWKGDLVHSVGLNYLALSDNAKSRAYLLAMEPYASAWALNRRNTINAGEPGGSAPDAGRASAARAARRQAWRELVLSRL